MEGARADLAAARAEVTYIKVEYSKSREAALMEVSGLQAWAEVTERKAAKVAEEVATARVMALSEY